MSFDLAQKEWHIAFGSKQSRDYDHRAVFFRYTVLEVQLGEGARRDERDHESVDEIDGHRRKWQKAEHARGNQVDERPACVRRVKDREEAERKGQKRDTAKIKNCSVLLNG